MAQRGSLGGGDDEGRRAGARDFGQFNRLVHAQRLGDPGDRFLGFGKQVLLEVAAGDRDPEVTDALRQRCRHRLDRPRGAGCVICIRSLHRVIRKR
jgi:hypothetical protein